MEISTKTSNQDDDWVDESPKSDSKPEAKPVKPNSERTNVVKTKKKTAVKAKKKVHPILTGGGKKKAHKAPVKKVKTLQGGKVTLNFKIVPSEAKAIRALADKAWRGNMTQMIRAKLLGLSETKKALSGIRKTTRV